MDKIKGQIDSNFGHLFKLEGGLICDSEVALEGGALHSVRVAGELREVHGIWQPDVLLVVLLKADLFGVVREGAVVA